MISPLQAALRAAITATVTRLYGARAAACPPIVARVAAEPRARRPRRARVAFELARRLRKAPRAIAQEIVAGARPARRASARSRPRRTATSMCSSTAPAFLRRGLGRRAPRRRPPPPTPPRQDHRRAHGDQPEQGGAHRPPAQLRARRHAGARCCASAACRSKCRTTSTTPASRSPTSSSASSELEDMTLDEVRRDRRHRRASTTTAGISTRASPSGTTATRTRLQIRAATLHDIEHGGNDDRRRSPPSSPTASSARHLKTMARLNVDYDLLTWEGDILRLKFWARGVRGAASDSGAVFLQTEGKLAGCWVMPIDDDSDERRRRGRRRRRSRADDDGDDERRSPSSARRSSSARTAPSPTSARTSPTSSGSSACSARTSTTARSRRAWTATRCGRRPATPATAIAGPSAVRRRRTPSTT